jgi:HEAT repeat protein
MRIRRPLTVVFGGVVLGMAALLFTLGRTGADSVCGETPDGAAAGDLAIPGIVFTGAPMFDEKEEGGEGVYQGSHHWRDGYIYPRGATYHRLERTIGPPRHGNNLYALIPAQPDGKLTQLTHLKDGAVFKPEPSFDGSKVLFSMRRDGEDWFHLYEINIDGTGLVQLTDGPFNDMAGVYLPDGRIVFCSDRGGYLDEYHEERTETLFTMHGDGSGIQQITFAPGTYFEPTVLKDGRILFSFWDAFHIDVPPLDKHETILMTVRPDGTEERHLFGGGQHLFFGRERHSGVGLTQAREMPNGQILVQSEMGPSLLDPDAGLSVRDALAPVFPGMTSAQIGGTTHRVHLSPLGTRSTPYPLADGRFLFSGTLPGARDSGIYVCDPKTRHTNLVFNAPNYAEFDAVPVKVARPKPKILADRQKKAAGKKTSHFLVVGGHNTDNPSRAAAMKKARYFRVIQAEYTGVTTSSHTNLATRILGVVPIQSDGSCYFEAPADTPLFLDPLDEAGNRVLLDWTFPNTSVEVGTQYPATQISYMCGRAGETKSCYGCHAPQTDAVPNIAAAALQYPPVKITRKSTNLVYRRNEPEAYRLQAKFDEAPKYAKWLKAKDAEVRARGCEMLMYIEDGAEPYVPTIVQLLKDKDVEVRRAAALALTRLATDSDAKALHAAMEDDDWLVAFHARAAVDALALWPDYMTEIQRAVPDVRAIRIAGKKKNPQAVKHLIPWLKQHKYEYHAAEAAIALGRIGTPEAVAALWEALRSEVPIKQVHISRYLQHGPRPEEYALVKALLIAKAVASISDLHLLIALLPNTFMEKPRYEDQMRAESQRVLMPRLMLDMAGCRKKSVELLIAALKGSHQKADPLYQQLLKGVNLERPFSEHGRPFPVVSQLGPEECVWLLWCLLDPATDLDSAAKKQQLEELVVPLLTSKNERERIDAAVLLGRTGFGPDTAKVLAAEAAKPYPFSELTSMGQGMPGTPMRDKAYMVQALAQHIDNVEDLVPFADPKKMTRDIRYGLVHGLAKRGTFQGLNLLVQMYRKDPITLVRTEAEYAIADILDQYRLAGKDVPQVTLGQQQPLEALYPPRGLTWTGAGTGLPPAPKLPSGDGPALAQALKQLLQPANFRNLSMAQVQWADAMMIHHVAETQHAFAQLAKTPGPFARKTLLQALDSPYPFAHYLAARALAERGDEEAIPVLLKKLDPYLQKKDTVGFWWACDALGRLKAKEAIAVLEKYAVPTNPPGLNGPPGMAVGYIAARTLGQIIADPAHPKIAALLQHENIWLKAGVLRGLAEVKAPGITALLEKAAQPENPAVVRSEAAVQLNRLGGKAGGQ